MAAAIARLTLWDLAVPALFEGASDFPDGHDEEAPGMRAADGRAGEQFVLLTQRPARP